jgi:hypothetical protein
MDRINMSRLVCSIMLAANFIVVLALVSAFIISPMAVRIPLAALLLVFALSLVMLFRELAFPSFLSRDQGRMTISWNNWTIEGRAVAIGLTGPKRKTLSLELADCHCELKPVGPLLYASSLIWAPLLQMILPDFLARAYYLNRRALEKKITSGEGVRMSFPAIIIGKRKIEKWIG